jgi:C-terminal processing protease CtpA/Prc
MRTWLLQRQQPVFISKLIPLAIVCCLARAFVLAQDFSNDEYVTGMTVVGRAGADSSCPPIVWVVTPDTPAAKAGIKPGDRLLAIDGHQGIDVVQARPFLHSKEPKPLVMDLAREHGSYSVTVGRIKASVLYEREGMKVSPDGGLYPKDATEAEMQRIRKIDREPTEKVFSVGHYPPNLELYYPGFEIFVWKAPQPMAVGGIEDGPAQSAGVHYGDAIVSVNGVNPQGKSLTELERLLSSPKPAKMTLVIDRDGEIKTFNFELAKASDVAALNKKQRYKGRMIPSVISEAYLHCWDPSAMKP